MLVLQKDFTFPFDVDATLVFWQPQGEPPHPDAFSASYYGETVSLYPHKEHIQLLRASIARGRNVIVWSGNGVAWCVEVLTKLVENKYLDNTDNIVVMSKPGGYVDDTPVDKWIGSRVYIEPNTNPYGVKNAK